LTADIIQDGMFIPFEKRKWTLEQHNHPEPIKTGSKLATHRIITSVKVEGDIMHYIDKLGYTLKTEFVKKGSLFMYGGIEVTIFRIFKVFK
jgi:hypothetical protein